MRIQNSSDYVSAPYEITPQDLAIIFDQLNLGFRRQMWIVNDIWENNKWILPNKYRLKNKKKKYLEDVLYQVDYLYHKEEIDETIEGIRKNAAELGIKVNSEKLMGDYYGISEYFKMLWIQMKYVNQQGYTRAKIRTILDKYHYKRRSDKFCEYLEECLYFYKIHPTVKGEECDVRTIPIDTMITFRMLNRRKRVSHD